MEVKEVEAAEMVAEVEAVGMEDLSVGVVAYPHPFILSLVSQEEAIGIQEVIGIVCNNITSKRHSCHSPCLFGVSAEEVPLDVTENVADADDENVADTDDVTKSRAPPAGKLGFKGKRANKKFGRVKGGSRATA